MNKDNLLLIVTIFFSILFIIIGMNICSYKGEVDNNEYYEAKVISIENNYIDEFSNMKTVEFSAKLLTGEYKGETYKMTQSIESSFIGITEEVSINDNIIVFNVEEVNEWVFVEYNRIGIILFLITVFLILILIIGKGQGFRTILSLVFTIVSILYIYIPAILNGYNVYFMTFVITMYIIFMSLTLINGYNKKTLSAILGNLGGVFIAGILGLFFNSILNLTGIIDQDYIFLTFLENGAKIDLQAIMWSGIVIGALGAVMDVSMSISSSMHELSINMKDSSMYKLITSGMNIGKDVIGTMTNTLILAYVGSSLATILLLTANTTSLINILNREMIVVEILQAILGSMGILFAVPFTVLFSARIFYNDR